MDDICFAPNLENNSVFTKFLVRKSLKRLLEKEGLFPEVFVPAA
jgi:hypothetical protein